MMQTGNIRQADTKELFSVAGIKLWHKNEHPVISTGYLAVENNSVVGLVGKNGAGKTTLVNSICGVHNKAEFESFRFEGVDTSPNDLSFKRNRYVCYAADESFRYWNLEQLISQIEASFFLSRDTDYLNKLLNGFAIEGLIKRKMSKLSSGQRKKVSLVSALYSRCKILLLDEPVDFLDFSSTEFLYQAIKDYSNIYGAIILCSHIAESFSRCCSQIYTLKEGSLNGSFDVPENSYDIAQLLE